MKVALCCIGRMENAYILDYVEHYKSLGVDKIFIYDNNHDNEECFEDVVSRYIDDGLVDVIDFRNKSISQLMAYQDCYDNHGKEYDWMCFFDIDEYLMFSDYKMDIHEFLSQDKFNGFSMIHINWKVFDDNDLIYYENKPVLERFKNPKLPLDFKKSYNFPENNHIKSIVRGGLEIKWTKTPHTPINVNNCCDANGKECNPSSPFNAFSFDSAWINHYVMKTIQEWLKIKVKRGYPDGNKNYFKKNDPILEFFKINSLTKEKLLFLSNNGYLDGNVDIFINTHKDFIPKVSNKCYKIIVGNHKLNKIKNYIDCSHESVLDDKFYSELFMMLYLPNIVQLKDYVGFCHYRKYFEFMDNILDMDKVFNRVDVIVGKPLILKKTIKEQYDICHNVEDLEIVGNIINEKFHDYSNVFNNFINGHRFYPYNMFIMKKDDFLEYSKFIKDVLDEYLKIVGTDIEKRINDNKDKYLKSFYPNDTVEYQYRIGGYLAERLTNVFILKNFKRIGVCPIKITEEKYNYRTKKVD